eukprot:scaffold329107_cov30-Prasinocladus_malaysianus.AAC.1
MLSGCALVYFFSKGDVSRGQLPSAGHSSRDGVLPEGDAAPAAPPLLGAPPPVTAGPHGHPRGPRYGRAAQLPAHRHPPRPQVSQPAGCWLVRDQGVRFRPQPDDEPCGRQLLEPLSKLIWHRGVRGARAREDQQRLK